MWREGIDTYSLEVVLHLAQLRHNCHGLSLARLLLNLRVLLLSAQRFFDIAADDKPQLS